MSGYFHNSWRLTWIFVALAVTGLEGPAHAQLYGTDPYDPDGRPFKAYAYPGAGEVYGGMGGRPRAMGAYNGPNQFDRMNDDLGFSTTGLGARGGGRYSNFDRSYDPNRYVPNEKADRKYFAEREKQEQAMLKASLERDPKKRAQMIREAELEAKKNASDTSLSVRRGESTGRSNVPPAPVRASRTRPAGTATSPSGSPTIPTPPALRSRTAATGSTTTAPPSRNRSTAAAADAKIPPPPPTSLSRPRGSNSTGSEPRPTDVLERARNFDRTRETPRTNSPRRLPDSP